MFFSRKYMKNLCNSLSYFIFALYLTEFISIIFKNTIAMNKSELVKAIAENAQLSQADAKKALDATLEAIAGAMKEGDKVALVGFGTFSVSERAAREGRNPATGEKMTIAAKKVVKFKAGAELAF
jgi:DNA-binding protein HU, beta subunit